MAPTAAVAAAPAAVSAAKAATAAETAASSAARAAAELEASAGEIGMIGTMAPDELVPVTVRVSIPRASVVVIVVVRTVGHEKTLDGINAVVDEEVRVGVKLTAADVPGPGPGTAVCVGAGTCFMVRVSPCATTTMFVCPGGNANVWLLMTTPLD